MQTNINIISLQLNLYKLASNNYQHNAIPPQFIGKLLNWNFETIEEIIPKLDNKTEQKIDEQVFRLKFNGKLCKLIYFLYHCNNNSYMNNVRKTLKHYLNCSTIASNCDYLLATIIIEFMTYDLNLAEICYLDKKW